MALSQKILTGEATQSAILGFKIKDLILNVDLSNRVSHQRYAGKWLTTGSGA